MSKSATLTIQRWGNSLAVRIPSVVARAARLELGQPVVVRVQDEGVAIVPIGERALTLSERLAKYDLDRHGGEVMTSRPVGKEAI